MQPARLCLAAAVLAIVLAASTSAHAALDTWAVVSSRKAETGNLADLVTVALSQDTTLRLVERQRILEVAKELALGTLLGSEGAGERSRVGRLLKADALVILGEETLDGKEYVRLVIADTRCGARLRTDYFLPQAGAAAALAETIRARVQETRARFAGGVRHVFGVPPFVCRNLTHDYDGLQTGYACLLSEALMSLPGVAVIETAEAHQIGREIGVAGAPGVDRVVPLFVEGEYEVTRPPVTPEAMVTIRVKIADGTGAVQTPAPRTLKLAEAGQYLGVELPAEVSRLTKGGVTVPLGADRQFAALAARAEEMARLGQWGLSTGLREAALLLKENDGPQRTAIMSEYHKILFSRFRPAPGFQEVPGNEIYDRIHRERVVVWYACLRHMEYMIRNRMTTTWKAATLTYGTFLDSHLWAKEDPRSAEAEQVKQRFVRDVYPLALALPAEAGYDNTDWWLHVLRDLSMYRYDRWGQAKEDLDRFLDLMENMIPEDCLFATFSLRPSDFQDRSEPYAYCTYSPQEYLEFVDRLKRSKRRTNALVGRYAELFYRFGQREQARSSKADLLPAFEKMLAEYQSMKSLPGYAFQAETDLRSCMIQIRKEMGQPEILPSDTPLVTAPKASFRLAPPMPRPVPAPYKPPPENTPPPGYATEGMQNSREAMGDPMYRDAPVGATIKFHEVPLQIKMLSGQIMPYGTAAQEDKASRVSALGKAYPRISRPLGFNRILACGDRFDVLWGRRTIFFLRQKGLAQVIFEKDTDSFLDVRWDGENVWIATCDEGIWVVSPAGKIVAKVGAEQGLPPATAILMWPLAPGRVCAAGGSDRGWCAMMELAGGQPRVNVFHAATTIPTIEYRGGATARDPTLAFIPRYILEFRSARGDQDLLLVGRDKTGTQWGQEYPLQIDLRSLKASVFDRPLGLVDNRMDGCYISRNGLLFGFNDVQVICVLAANGETLPDGTAIKYLCRAPGVNHRFMAYQGRLYLVSVGSWHRVDPTTLAAERVQLTSPGPLITGTDVSALYGLVGWNGGTLYQAEIIESTATPAAPPANSSTTSPAKPFPSVPPKSQAGP